jgi:hypothetical protein
MSCSTRSKQLALGRWLVLASLILTMNYALAVSEAPGVALPKSAPPWVLRVYFDDISMVQEMAEISAPWEVNRSQKFAVMGIHSLADYQRLLDLGVKIAIDEKKTRRLTSPPKIYRPDNKSIPGYSCYRTVEETFASMDNLATTYPDLVELVDIGDTWEKINLGAGAGYDLRVIKITNKNITETKPVLYAMGSIHAREMAPAELVTRFAEYLLGQYASNGDIRWLLDHHEIHLLLEGNPDGRKQAETGAFWRKNTNQNYCGATSSSRGADMNRNFSFQWGGTGASTDPCNDTYRGAFAASEPETDAIETYVRSILPDQRGPGLNDPAPLDATGVYLDIHSYSELVLWPYGFDATSNAPNEAEIEALGRKFAWFNGYTPEQSNELYPAAGASDDFAYGELGVAAYTFELGTQFFQDCATFENTIVPDNLPALVYAAKSARTPYMTGSGPDVENLALSSTVVQQGDTVTITGLATDTHFSNANSGTQTAQNIQSVQLYLAEKPWDPASSPQALAATDGSFNSSSENFTGTIDTTGMASGEYQLYVTVTDAGGTTGVPYGALLTVIDPATAATVQGQVSDAVSGAAIGQATIAYGNVSAVSATDGSYQFITLPGTRNLSASASGYASKTIPGVTTQAGQTLTQNIQLEPYCDIFLDDVENGAGGWQGQAPWAIVAQTGGSPSHAWTDSPGGNYANSINISLTSQSLDLSQANDPILHFMHRCDTESGYDFGYVELSLDGGGSWQTVYQCDGQASWQAQQVAIPAAAGQADVKIRFRLETDTSVTRDGWSIDDVRITGWGNACHGNVNDLIFKHGFE